MIDGLIMAALLQQLGCVSVAAAVANHSWLLELSPSCYLLPFRLPHSVRDVWL